jgi:hypothetical protein
MTQLPQGIRDEQKPTICYGATIPGTTCKKKWIDMYETVTPANEPNLRTERLTDFYDHWKYRNNHGRT